MYQKYYLVLKICNLSVFFNSSTVFDFKQNYRFFFVRTDEIQLIIKAAMQYNVGPTCGKPVLYYVGPTSFWPIGLTETNWRWANVRPTLRQPLSHHVPWSNVVTPTKVHCLSLTKWRQWPNISLPTLIVPTMPDVGPTLYFYLGYSPVWHPTGTCFTFKLLQFQ